MNIISQNDALLAAIKRDMADAARWRKLREIVGYVENGTDASVTLSQDDATRSWLLRVGTARAFHGTLDEALDAAFNFYCDAEENSL